MAVQKSERMDYCHYSCMEEEDRPELRASLASFGQTDCEDAWRMLWKDNCQVWGQTDRRDGGTQCAGARRWLREGKVGGGKIMSASKENCCSAERIIGTSPK